jgi:hypothetical protein
MRSAILDDPVGLFLPGCAGEERKLRERLLKAREFGSVRLLRLRSREARTLTWLSLDTVTAHLYASVPLEELQDAVHQCLRLTMCANFAEQQGGDE